MERTGCFTVSEGKVRLTKAMIEFMMNVYFLIVPIMTAYELWTGGGSIGIARIAWKLFLLYGYVCISRWAREFWHDEIYPRMSSFSISADAREKYGVSMPIGIEVKVNLGLENLKLCAGWPLALATIACTACYINNEIVQWLAAMAQGLALTGMLVMIIAYMIWQVRKPKGEELEESEDVARATTEAENDQDKEQGSMKILMQMVFDPAMTDEELVQKFTDSLVDFRRVEETAKTTNKGNNPD